ncbi:glutamyl-tRNA(Gln) amidotransferase, subunit A, partial [Metarhizium hybridum]
MLILFLAQLAALFVSIVSAKVVSRQIQLGQHEYFMPPSPSWKVPSWDSNWLQNATVDEFVPITVMNLNGTKNDANIRAMLDKFNATDDVWTSSFTLSKPATPVWLQIFQLTSIQVLYIQSSNRSASTLLQKEKPDQYTISKLVFGNTDRIVPSGPYFLHTSTGNAYQAYRLFADTNQAFIQSSYQDPQDTHHPLRAAISSDAGLTVAVPSRLYYTPTKDKPLAGVRISVKDLFDLKGLKTSGGNRAFYARSNIKNETAIAVQKLIDAGAVVVGKVKLSDFAFGGSYFTSHIDYLLPFNPRGDGYNLASDSSGGSGASVASYDWLDASVGSDTGGSVRGPAQQNGVHGNRPTHGAVDLSGAIPLSPAMDTAGMLARDPLLLSKINRVLYAGSVKDFAKFPKSILLDPSSAKQLSAAEQEYPKMAAAANNFLNHLSKILAANVSTFSIDEAWNKSTPVAFNTTPIANAVNRIYGGLTRYEQWNDFGKAFVSEYMETHNGEFPHMVPDVRVGWLRANASLTEDAHKGDLKDKSGVAEWVAQKFLTRDEDTCSNTIYVYFAMPYKSYKPDISGDWSNPYIAELLSSISKQELQILQQNVTINCNTTLGSKETCEHSQKALEEAATVQHYPVSPGRLASVADLPDYALTLGSFDLGNLTFSESTLKNQSLPLAVDIMAAKGCDVMILNLVEELYRVGAIRTAKTGVIV